MSTENRTEGATKPYIIRGGEFLNKKTETPPPSRLHTVAPPGNRRIEDLDILVRSMGANINFIIEKHNEYVTKIAELEASSDIVTGLLATLFAVINNYIGCPKEEFIDTYKRINRIKELPKEMISVIDALYLTNNEDQDVEEL